MNRITATFTIDFESTDSSKEIAKDIARYFAIEQSKRPDIINNTTIYKSFRIEKANEGSNT